MSITNSVKTRGIFYVDHGFCHFSVKLRRLFYVDHKFRQNRRGIFTIIALFRNIYVNYLCRSQIPSKRGGIFYVDHGFCHFYAGYFMSITNFVKTGRDIYDNRKIPGKFMAVIFMSIADFSLSRPYNFMSIAKLRIFLGNLGKLWPNYLP